MRWIVTVKNQTYGLHTEVLTYEVRVTRSRDVVRVSFENRGAGNLREGHMLLSLPVARLLGAALDMAAGATQEDVNIVFTAAENKVSEMTA